MYFDNKIWIGDSEGEKVSILPQMANRHGLIAGATGTGKTVTLKVLAESFSDAGVPVFLADVKGDLGGMCRMGEDSADMQERIRSFGLDACGFSYQSYPTTFWDIYGQGGIPLRTTISEMGPILLSKLLELNDTQANILTILFKIADDENLLLIDTKDLKAMLQYLSDHNADFVSQYGNMSKQSIGAIMRSVVALEAQGGEQFFTEPALNIADWFTAGAGGKGMINVLDCRELINNSVMYSTFLLWMLSELFSVLPEVGDLPKPRMIFFFDEAHLLFKNISRALQDKIEQVVKLVRSKGVGVYFITQNPRDLPDSVLSQLGNKIQHALRAYTPSDERAVKTAADSFRPNPAFDTRTAITSLGTGEALVSVLDEDGIPGIVKKCRILPPQSRMGSIPEEERRQEALTNNLYLKYQTPEDPDSAYEILARLTQQQWEEEQQRKKELEEEKARQKEEARLAREAEKEEQRLERERLREEQRLERERIKAAEQEEKLRLKEEQEKERAIKNGVKSVANTAAGTVGREVGNAIGKTFGGTFGKRLGGNLGAQLGRSILGTFFK